MTHKEKNKMLVKAVKFDYDGMTSADKAKFDYVAEQFAVKVSQIMDKYENRGRFKVI